MNLYTYLNYGGNCREAFEFYVEHLGAKIISLAAHGDAPGGGNPALGKSTVLHARLELGDTILMGADVPAERFEPMRSAYLTLLTDSSAEAERLYALLSDGGQIFMKMEETFYAHRFAMLRDRFGTSWMLMHEREQQ
jgi:PhnB protein